MKNLDDEGFGQNKVVCSSSEIDLPMVKQPLQALQRSLRQGDGSPTIRRLLALEPYWLGFLLVIFSLSPQLARFLAHAISRPYFRIMGS